MISEDVLHKGVSVLKRTITVRQPRRFRLPEKGEVISHGERNYYIGEKLGRGGFGVVYECSDDWGNPLVAKVILPHERPYAEVRESWLEEASKLMDLRHPNITFVRDAFEHQDTFYLIIERCNFPLLQVITSFGLDAERFGRDLGAPETQQKLLTEIESSRRLGINSFPSLAVVDGERLTHIGLNYTDATAMLNQIEALIE